MIPKIIHFCWLSGDEYPPLIEQCMKSWKDKLSDYEIIIWDAKKFDVNSVKWTKEAFCNKKYAFAADYIRLFALYNYGGIYLDSDVIVYKNFDDLLDLPYFIGEDYTHSFEPAIIGTEKNNPWIKGVLDYYAGKSFIDEEGKFDLFPLPCIFYTQLHKSYKFVKLKETRKYILSSTMYIYDRDFFNSRNRVGVKKSKLSYCAHNYAGSWTTKENSLKAFIINLLPNTILNFIFYFTNKINKKKINMYSIPFITLR